MIHGHSCAGKSIVVETLMSKHEKLFMISADKIKRFISKYHREKHAEVVYNLLTNLSKKAISKNFSLIVEGMGVAFLKKGIEFFKSLAKRNRMRFVEVNIETSFHIAKERFKERLSEVKIRRGKISNKSHIRFKYLYCIYKKDKNEKISSFDSSKLSPKQIANRIEKLISQN